MHLLPKKKKCCGRSENAVGGVVWQICLVSPRITTTNAPRYQPPMRAQVGAMESTRMSGDTWEIPGRLRCLEICQNQAPPLDGRSRLLLFSSFFVSFLSVACEIERSQAFSDDRIFPWISLWSVGIVGIGGSRGRSKGALTICFVFVVGTRERGARSRSCGRSRYRRPCE